jgi:thiol-disulfide isomerase/thioredoxin
VARVSCYDPVMRYVAIAVALAIGCRGGSAADDSCAGAKLEGTFAWFADDYPAALRCARSRGVPVVVDLWAPWCHTCLSMKATVFADASLADQRDRFVFVELDTDKEQNAPALARLSISAWPTYYVLAHADEKVLARFVGAASTAQFRAFLDAGARAVAGGAAGADAHLLGAERALAVKDYAAADTELTAAIAAAPQEWPRRPDALVSLILTKHKRGDAAGCLAVAETWLDKTGTAASASDFLVTATACASERAKDEPDRVRALRERAVVRWTDLLARSHSLSIDDASDAMASMRETLDALGNTNDARELADKQRGLLDDAAARAKTPLEAMTYNWPRAEVYQYLGRPLDLVPALEKSARDLPGEYDPRARLGWIYWKAGKLEDAAKHTDDALVLAYGPRKARMLSQRAEIASAAGDRGAEKRFRAAAVAQYEALPASQQLPDALAKAKQALAAMDKPGKP